MLANSRTTTGKIGEEIASDFLKRRGYHVLERNWRHGHHEIDIVARDGHTLVFVEVKTRSTDAYGFPEDAVTAAKENSLQLAAEAYLLENNQVEAIRFDIIAIIQGRKSSVHHVPDAFFPSEW